MSEVYQEKRLADVCGDWLMVIARLADAFSSDDRNAHIPIIVEAHRAAEVLSGHTMRWGLPLQNFMSGHNIVMSHAVEAARNVIKEPFFRKHPNGTQFLPEVAHLAKLVRLTRAEAKDVMDSYHVIMKMQSVAIVEDHPRIACTDHQKSESSPNSPLDSLKDPVPVVWVADQVGRKAGRRDKLGDKFKRRGFPVRLAARRLYCERADAIKMFPHYRKRLQETVDDDE